MINRRDQMVMRTFSAIGFGLAAVAAMGQTATPAGAPAAKLTPYTTPDKTASAGIPSGWKVTQGAQGLIQISGPNGEFVNLGVIMLVKDGPYQAAKPGSSPVWLSMPNSTPLAQKYSMVLQAINGNAAAQSANLQVQTSTAIPISKTIADCAVFTGTVNLPSGPGRFEVAFCSLPVDGKGVYKLIWKGGSLPNSVVAQERATAEAVIASYQVPQAILMKILSPYDAPPSQAPAAGTAGGTEAQTAAILAATRRAQQVSDQQFQCFDLGVLREVPERNLPAYCR